MANIAGYDLEKVKAELAIVDAYKDTYQEGKKGDGKGYDLYHNTVNGFPRDKQGRPNLPPGSVVALVNGECEHCHTFMSLSSRDGHYRTRTAAGQPIYYIDMHTTQGVKDAEALGITGDAGKNRDATAVGRNRLNGELLLDRDGTEVSKAVFPTLLNVGQDGKLQRTVYSSGVIESVERVTGQPILQAELAVKRPARHEPKLTNTDVPIDPQTGLGDESDQTNYMSLKPPQKDMVDRAIYGIIMRREGPVDAYGKSKSTEAAIEQMREGYAAPLRAKHGPELEANLTRLAQGAPDATTARRTLNTIIAVDGDQTCGCKFNDPTIDLNQYILQNKATQGAAR